MNSKETNHSFCQSCGMSMESPEDYGTNFDGTKNREYCHFCFHAGRFTNPNMTKEQMVERGSGLMGAKFNTPEKMARKAYANFISALKRWRIEKTNEEKTSTFRGD